MRKFVNYDVKDRVALVTLDRPPVNALDSVTFDEMHQVIDEISENRECRVMIFTATGKSFSAGADLKAADGMDEEARRAFAPTGPRLTARLAAIQLPTICAMNGFAVGGGLEIALAFDFRIASTNARFGQGEIGIGLMPGAGGTQRLPRLIGKTAAKRLILTGEMIGADEAWRLGLVDAVVPPESLLPEAQKLASAIASKNPLAVKLAKKAIDEGFELPLKDGLEVEWKCFNEVISSEDFEEGIRAFAEKRQPVFKG